MGLTIADAARRTARRGIVCLQQQQIGFLLMLAIAAPLSDSSFNFRTAEAAADPMRLM